MSSSCRRSSVRRSWRSALRRPMPGVGAALPHLAGCGQLGPDLQMTHDTLAAYCRHPNVGAVLVVALGCEQVIAQHLAADGAKPPASRAEIIAIQSGGRHRPRHGARRRRGASDGGGCVTRRTRLVRRRIADRRREMRRLGLHIGARVQSGARSRRRSHRRPRRRHRPRRDCRDHGRRTRAGGPRDERRDVARACCV